jgi:NAD-dependent dihydropyrimidine dehydrogenase PreA subunit
MYPVVDKEKCMSCGNCVEICPSEVYVMEADKSVPVRPEDCIECGACVDQCPVDAIELCED